MADIQQVVLLWDKRGWSVKVVLQRGRARRYRCSSEAQARYFAAVFELGPRVLPPGGFPLPKRARFGEAARVRRR
jgi:hypothetical protein